MTFDEIEIGQVFISVRDKVEVGRRFRVVRKIEKPKHVFMSRPDRNSGYIEIDFTMAEIKECLRPVEQPGRAWIEGEQRAIEKPPRQITRGKNKGRVEVTFKKYKAKKVIIDPADVVIWPETGA